MNFVVISTLPRWQAGAAQRNGEISIKIDVQSSRFKSRDDEARFFAFPSYIEICPLKTLDDYFKAKS